LVIGPVIAALGFASLAVPDIGGSYWATFFPAILLLGLGMTITVAPLTTTVMNALDLTHAGAASGVNNAVSRLAGVLAIALLGILMSQAFDHELAQRGRNLAVSPWVSKQLELQHDRLAAITPPLSATEDEQQAIKTAIGGSFVYGFRCVMAISAFLAAVSSLTAWLMVDRNGNGKK
jgi:hypothetical protein